MRRGFNNRGWLNKIQRFIRHSIQILLSRPRLSLVGIVLLSFGLSLHWFFDTDSTHHDSRPALLENGQEVSLENTSGSLSENPLPSIGQHSDSLLPRIALETEQIDNLQSTDHPEDTSQQGYQWQPVTVNSGDSLGSIFKRLSLSPALVHNIATLDESTRQLTRLNVGEVLDIAYDQQSQFKALRRAQTEQEWLVVEQAADNTLTTQTIERNITRRERTANGVITGNLFVSGKQAGLRDALIMQLARIFGWDIDFALDIRRGDRFVVIYEEIWRDGEYLRDGDILATSFVNRGETFQALRYITENGTDYFSSDGKPMRKAFLRTPLDFARVTSNFNPRRMHPVLKRVRPHNGVDYGASTGTPVYSTGDGTVMASAYSSPNGNYVFVRHTNDIVTKYLHFSRRAVNKGDRVKQGQTIGYVGSTGLATAAHLHYEFLVGGVHRNPRTVDLPEAIPLSSEQTQELLVQHQANIATLAELDASQQAMASTIAGGQ